MDLENPRAKIGGAEPRPHPDYQENYSFYTRMMKKVKFEEYEKDGFIIPHVCLKEYKQGDQFLNSEFAYGEFGPGCTVMVLSFHQPNRTFREEWCAILNHLGYKGLISRIETPRTKTTIWDT